MFQIDKPATGSQTDPMLNHLLTMGSAERPDVKPHLPMAEHDRRSIKSILKKPFQALFQKEKKKEKKQVVVAENKPTATAKPAPKVTPVSVLLENFQKLEIEKKDEEDELANFTYKVVEDDRVPVRTDSHSSEDSGFSEKGTAETEEENRLVDSLKELKVDTKDCKQKKEKKVQTVFVSRGPDRRKASDYGATVHPYSNRHQDAENVYRQVRSSLFSYLYFLRT